MPKQIQKMHYIFRAFEIADLGRSTSFSKSTKSPKSEEGLAIGTGTPFARGLFSCEHFAPSTHEKEDSLPKIVWYNNIKNIVNQ